MFHFVCNIAKCTYVWSLGICCVCLCSLLALNAVASVLNDAYRKIIPHVICALDQAINTIYQRCECEYYTCRTCTDVCECVSVSGHIVGCHCIDDMKYSISMWAIFLSAFLFYKFSIHLIHARVRLLAFSPPLTHTFTFMSHCSFELNQQNPSDWNAIRKMNDNQTHRSFKLKSIAFVVCMLICKIIPNYKVKSLS